MPTWTPALHAFVLPDVRARGVHRDWKHESSRASGTGHAFSAATVGHGQTERLLKAALV